MYKLLSFLPNCSIDFILFVVQCPPLNLPGNGMVEVTGRAVGSTAIYTCNEGFDPYGYTILICESNGAWSSAPPICSNSK